MQQFFPLKTCNKRCNYLRGIKTSFSQIHTRTARMKKGEEWNFWQSVAKNSNFLVKFYFSSSSLIFILFSDSQIGCCVTSYSICARLARSCLCFSCGFHKNYFVMRQYTAIHQIIMKPHLLMLLLLWASWKSQLPVPFGNSINDYFAITFFSMEFVPLVPFHLPLLQKQEYVIDKVEK